MRMNARNFAAPALVMAALLAGATGARAQEMERAVPTIRVSATGESRAAPDRAWVDFGVETEAATARQAADENARKMEAVIAALVRSGIARANIQTSGYNVFPVYEPVPGREDQQPRLRGYRVVNTATVQTDDVARVGTLLDAGLAAGANRVNSVRFGLRDPARAREAALRDALTRARAEAAVIADGLGVRLGRVLDASTAYSPPQPYPVAYRREAMAMDAAGAATPIEPGQQEVSATVTVVFQING